MTRKTKPESIEKEKRLQEAISEFQTGSDHAADIIRAHNIPARTFYRRLSGVPPRNKAHEKDQFLTHTVEKVLVQWITRLTEQGYALRHSTVRETAQYIRNRRVSSNGQIDINPPTVGE
jgi:hypothetical protein